MKLSAKKGDLQRALQTVTGLINPRNPLPILTHVKLEAEKETLTLSATDLSISVKVIIPAVVSAAGGVTVPKHLLDLVREISGEATAIVIGSDEESRVRLTCDKTDLDTVLTGGAVAEYPEIEQVKEKLKFAMPVEELLEMIRRTAFAASTQDEGRAYLTGINFVARDKTAIMVATNSHKLALVRRAVGAKKGLKDFNVVVPVKAMQELVRGLADREGEVEIGIGDNYISFKTDQLFLTARLIDEEYPDYNRVVPQKALKYNIRIDAIRFEEAIRTVAVVSDEKSRMLKLTFTKNRVTVQGSSGLVGGEGKESVEIEFPKDETIEVAFNADYLKEVVQQFRDVDLEFQANDGTHPCMFVEPGNDAFLYLLMPMRS